MKFTTRIVTVRFLFKRKPDDLAIIGLSSLFLTHEVHEALTDEIALNKLPSTNSKNKCQT